MEFTKYTTEDLEIITANFSKLQEELKRRKCKEYVKCFFEEGDVLYCTNKDGDEYFIKVKEISERYNNVIYDEIVISNEGSFDYFDDEWDDYNRDWSEYKKLDDTSIFAELKNMIEEHNNTILKTNNMTFNNLKNLAIEHLKIKI